MLLVGAGDVEVEYWAERVRVAIAGARDWLPGGGRVTVSIGIATLGRSPCALADLVKRADDALYAAKSRGRNRFVNWKSLPRKSKAADVALVADAGLTGRGPVRIRLTLVEAVVAGHRTGRGGSRVRHLSKFYGQWGGETHLEQISVDGLLRLLDAELGPGVTELTCHAGYVDEGLSSSYRVEREAELRTLCDPRVRPALVERSIRLVGFRDLPALMAASPVSEGAA